MPFGLRKRFGRRHRQLGFAGGPGAGPIAMRWARNMKSRTHRINIGGNPYEYRPEVGKIYQTNISAFAGGSKEIEEHKKRAEVISAIVFRRIEEAGNEFKTVDRTELFEGLNKTGFFPKDVRSFIEQKWVEKTGKPIAAEEKAGLVRVMASRKLGVHSGLEAVIERINELGLTHRGSKVRVVRDPHDSNKVELEKLSTDRKFKEFNPTTKALKEFKGNATERFAIEKPEKGFGYEVHIRT